MREKSGEQRKRISVSGFYPSPIRGVKSDRLLGLRIAFENIFGSRGLLFVILDRSGCTLSTRLTLGLFRAAGDVDGNRNGNLGMQRHTNLRDAQGLDRVLEYHLAAVDRQAGSGGGIRNAGGRHRAVQAARLTGLADDDDGQTADTLGQTLGFLAALDVLHFKL